MKFRIVRDLDPGMMEALFALSFTTDQREGIMLQHRSGIALSALALALVGIAPPSALAQQPPASFVASPDVYKVVGENAQFRVVEATWKPGQRDVLHAHPQPDVTYAITACKRRSYAPDGSIQVEGVVPQGTVNVRGPTGAHTFENIGTTECRILFVERK
jgi:hypothetical protein